ncbi:hypothetical protein LXL04_017838 [Taraxacum kok-saghyz]
MLDSTGKDSQLAGHSSFEITTATKKTPKGSSATKIGTATLFSTLPATKIEPGKMTISSASSFSGSRKRNRKVRICACGDVCGLSISGTPWNPGREFWGCPNYQVEGRNCGYFKWVDEDDEENGLREGRETVHIADCRNVNKEQMKPMLEVIIVLLVVILVMVTIGVFKM